MGLIAIEEALHVPLLDIFPTKNNRIEKALQCAPLLGTESPLPRLACSHLLEKSQLRHLSNSPTCIRRHCQPICRVSQGKCQKLIDDLREEYFTLLSFFVSNELLLILVSQASLVPNLYINSLAMLYFNVEAAISCKGSQLCAF